MSALGVIGFCIVAAIFIFFGLVVFIGAPYVPSQKKYIKRAFTHFGVLPSDTLVDIGSGDGIVLRIASSFGARAIGYEINVFLVGLSRLLSLHDPRVKVRFQNLWTAQLPDETTIVYAFYVSRDRKRVAAFVQREANRIGKPLRLLSFGSPLKHVEPTDEFEAYHLYTFHPLQVKKA